MLCQIYFLGASLGQLSIWIPNFDVFFVISAPLCYDVTMKSVEILGNSNGSAEKRCDPKIIFYIYLCKICFFD